MTKNNNKPFTVEPTKHQTLNETMVAVAQSKDKDAIANYMSQITKDPEVAHLLTTDRDLFENGFVKLLRALHSKD